MVVALPALWLAAVLIAFYLAAKIILTPMIVGVLKHIPAVGRFIARAAGGIVGTVEDAIASWLRPHLITVVRWLQAAAAAAIAVPDATEYLAKKLEDALSYLVLTKIPRLVHGVTDTIVHAVNTVSHAVTAVAHDLAATEQRLQHGIEHGIRDLREELNARLARGIDTLRHDIFDRAIPGIEADIARAARAAEADIARVGKDVEGVASRLADLAKRLDIPLTMLEQLIATIGIVGALEALETLATCRGKLRTLCTYDPGAWDDLLLGLLALLAFPGLREMARMGATLMDDVSGVVKELAES